MKSLYVTGSLSIESKTHAMLLPTSMPIQIQWLLHEFNTASTFILCKHVMSIGNKKSTNTSSTKHVKVGRYTVTQLGRLQMQFSGNTQQPHNSHDLAAVI